MPRLILMAAMACLAALPAQAEDFKGKTITIITSTGAGGTYDLIARMFSRHMPRHIPGQPNMIVQNMPGGGNVLATNHLYNIAPKDGTMIGVVNNAIPLHQALGGKGVRYDARKFNWLGSTGARNSVTIAWHTSGIKTIQEVMQREVTLGGTGAGSSIVIFPTVMNHVLGTKFKIIMGYKSSEEVYIALERGEVQARSGSFTSLLAEYPNWLQEKKVNILVQVGLKPDEQLPNVPMMTDLAKTDEQRQVLKLVSLPIALGQPYLAPPDVPADTVAVLRDGLARTMKDKGFLAEAEKLKFEIYPMTGDEVAAVVNDTINAPPEVVAKAQAAMGPKKKR